MEKDSFSWSSLRGFLFFFCSGNSQESLRDLFYDCKIQFLGIHSLFLASVVWSCIRLFKITLVWKAIDDRAITIWIRSLDSWHIYSENPLSPSLVKKFLLLLCVFSSLAFLPEVNLMHMTAHQRYLCMCQRKLISDLFLNCCLSGTLVWQCFSCRNQWWLQKRECGYLLRRRTSNEGWRLQYSLKHWRESMQVQ